MRLLLDTHVWLWMLAAPERLGAVRPVIDDADNELLLSAASSWEIAIKHHSGRLTLPGPPQQYVPGAILQSGVTPLPVHHAHALAVAELPGHHRDPFDRLLIAQAQQEAVPIITADRVFDAYGVDLIRAG